MPAGRLSGISCPNYAAKESGANDPKFVLKYFCMKMENQINSRFELFETVSDLF